MKDDTAHIVSLIKAGKHDGYRLILKLYSQRIHAFMLDVTGSQQDAEELVNDTFIRVFSSITRYDPSKASLYTWVMCIAHNIAISNLRKKKRPATVELEQIADTEIKDDDIEDPRVMLLREAIGMLNPEDRSIIHQYYYDHTSVEDIAYIIGHSAGTTAVRLHRIRQKLIETNQCYDR